jgi:hypothetical protein
MTSKFSIKLIFFLALIYFTHTEDLDITTRFKSCDPQWGNEELWINFARPGKFNYTFCNDETDKVSFLDAKLMTLLADYANSKKITCGEFGECTPKAINDFIKIYNRSDELFDTLNLGALNHFDNTIDIQAYLKDNYILGSCRTFNDVYKCFLFTKSDDQTVYGIDNEGTDVSSKISELSKIVGWQYANSPKLLFLE